MRNAIVRPARCSLVNVTTGESMDCLFNPTEFSEKVAVNWNRQVVPGLSHHVLQYQSTGNRQLPSVEFYLDKLFAGEQPGSGDILAFRTFVRSLTVPMGAGQSVASTVPPRTLFIWPGVITMETIVSDLEFHYRKFSATGDLLVYTAVCSFEEILDSRVTSEDRRNEVT